MANWNGTARSNYFKVKPGLEDAFEEWVEESGMELIADKEGRYGFIGNDPDSGGFRNHYTCPQCGHSWQDSWTATCDDDCPSCGKRHISPTHSEDMP